MADQVGPGWDDVLPPAYRHPVARGGNAGPGFHRLEPPVTLFHCPYCPAVFRSDENAVRRAHADEHRRNVQPIPAVPWGPGSDRHGPLVWDPVEERWIDRKDPA